jgi:hypothetical protein
VSATSLAKKVAVLVVVVPTLVVDLDATTEVVVLEVEEDLVRKVVVADPLLKIATPIGSRSLPELDSLKFGRTTVANSIGAPFAITGAPLILPLEFLPKMLRHIKDLVRLVEIRSLPQQIQSPTPSSEPTSRP